MVEKIEIIKEMKDRWDFEEFEVAVDEDANETVVEFYFYYMEEQTNDPFIDEVFTEAKNFELKGADDDSGRVYMKLVFNGVIEQ